MNQPRNSAQRLIPALPDVPFVRQPDEIDRFEVRILPNGALSFKGSRKRIQEFLDACAAEGVILHVDHISLCG